MNIYMILNLVAFLMCTIVGIDCLKGDNKDLAILDFVLAGLNLLCVIYYIVVI